MTSIEEIKNRFPAGATITLHGRKLKVDGVIECGPATQRHGTLAMVGLSGPRGAVYTANAHTDGTIGGLITLPRM